jgi:hypothetical protein
MQVTEVKIVSKIKINVTAELECTADIPYVTSHSSSLSIWLLTATEIKVEN